MRPAVQNWWPEIVLPTAVVTAFLVGSIFAAWEYEQQRKQDQLKREIAYNLITQWKRCDLAKNWDGNISCPK